MERCLILVFKNQIDLVLLVIDIHLFNDMPIPFSIHEIICILKAIRASICPILKKLKQLMTNSHISLFFL